MDKINCIVPDSTPPPQDVACTWKVPIKTPATVAADPTLQIYDTTYDLEALKGGPTTGPIVGKGYWSAMSNGVWYNNSDLQNYAYRFDVCGTLPPPADVKPACQSAAANVRPATVAWQVGFAECFPGWTKAKCVSPDTKKTYECSCLQENNDAGRDAAESGYCFQPPGPTTLTNPRTWCSDHVEAAGVYEGTCNSLGVLPSTTADYFSLADPLQPAAGVTLTFRGGGGKPNECPNNRTFTLTLLCSSEDTMESGADKMEEPAQCSYSLQLKTPHACPIECGATAAGAPLCSARGQCEYNRDELRSMCICEPGYMGATCDTPVPPDQALCAPGTVWDATDGQCEPDTSAVCGSGTKWVAAENRCMPDAYSAPNDGGKIAGAVIGTLFLSAALGFVYVRHERERSQQLELSGTAVGPQGGAGGTAGGVRASGAVARVDLQAEYSAL
eukprot:g1071.t1